MESTNRIFQFRSPSVWICFSLKLNCKVHMQQHFLKIIRGMRRYKHTCLTAGRGDRGELSRAHSHAVLVKDFLPAAASQLGKDSLTTGGTYTFIPEGHEPSVIPFIYFVVAFY